jgi:hypothetical protein
MAALALFVALNLSAMEAIQFYSEPALTGYAFNGAGFVFSPLTSISMTSLGFSGADLINQDYQVMVLDAGGAELATALITASDPLYNQTHYKTITPVNLSAGQTYYIGGVGVLNGYWLGKANLLPPDPDATGTISVAPQIAFLGGAAGPDAIGHWPSTIMPNAFLEGVNFQYVVPEPSALALSGGFLLLLMFRRPRGTGSAL